MLFLERGELVGTNWLPICPVCGKPILAGDMHEVILTRGDIQSLSPELQAMIYTRQNCVIVHTINCHVLANQKQEQEKCIAYLIEKEGVESILEWLNSISQQIDSSQVSDAIRKVLTVSQSQLLERTAM